MRFTRCRPVFLSIACMVHPPAPKRRHVDLQEQDLVLKRRHLSQHGHSIGTARFTARSQHGNCSQAVHATWISGRLRFADLQTPGTVRGQCMGGTYADIMLLSVGRKGPEVSLS